MGRLFGDSEGIMMWCIDNSRSFVKNKIDKIHLVDQIRIEEKGLFLCVPCSSDRHGSALAVFRPLGLDARQEEASVWFDCEIETFSALGSVLARLAEKEEDPT